MILSGKEIEKKIGSDIIIKPFNKKQLNPNSYNLRIHNKLAVYKDCELNIKEKNSIKELIIPNDGLVLKPNVLYLGRTVEYTETHGLIPMLEGRSSVGRLGLFIHITAGFGDVGFCGYWTLEMYCIHPIKIFPNIELCQIYYHTIKGKYDNYQSDKYQNNEMLQESLMYKEFIKD